MAIVVPAVCIQSNTELEYAVIINSGRSAESLHNLLSVKPNFEKARVVTGPFDLHNHLVPLSSTDLAKVSQSIDISTAVRLAIVSSYDSREQLVSLNPHHGRGHIVVTPAICSWTVGNELGNVVGLVLEVPCIRETEGKAIEGRVTTLVAVVVVDLGVVAVVVVGVVGLGHLESRATLVNNVGDLIDGSLVLFANIVPAVEGARVVKCSGC